MPAHVSSLVCSKPPLCYSLLHSPSRICQVPPCMPDTVLGTDCEVGNSRHGDMETGCAAVRWEETDSSQQTSKRVTHTTVRLQWVPMPEALSDGWTRKALSQKIWVTRGATMGWRKKERARYWENLGQSPKSGTNLTI